MKVLRFISYLIVGTLVLSCTHDTERPPHPNLGNYEVSSLTADVALDLDYDGVYSSDFKKELKRLWFDQKTHLPSDDLEISQDFTDNNSIFFVMQGIPRDTYNDSQMYLEDRFVFNDYYTTLITDGANVLYVSNDPPPTSPDRPGSFFGTPKPQEVVFNDRNTVTVKIKQGFYDLPNEEWVPVNLVAVFKREPL